MGCSEPSATWRIRHPICQYVQYRVPVARPSSRIMEKLCRWPHRRVCVGSSALSPPASFSNAIRADSRSIAVAGSATSRMPWMSHCSEGPPRQLWIVGWMVP